MAMIYLATNRFNAAEPLLRLVIALDGGTSEVIQQEQAQSESLLGLGFVAQRRYAEAEFAFNRAVMIRRELQGSKHPELGDELNNLAWAQIEQGKFVEARPSMVEALKILRISRGDKDLTVARALDGLARIDISQLKLTEAELKFQRMVVVFESLDAAQQAQLGDGLKQYADLLDRLGRADEASRIRSRRSTARVEGKLDDTAYFSLPKASNQPLATTPRRP